MRKSYEDYSLFKVIYNCFEEKEHPFVWVASILTAFISTITWIFTVTDLLFESYHKFIYEISPINGKEVINTSGSSLLLIFWTIAFSIFLLVGISVVLSRVLLILECKRNSEESLLKTFLYYVRHDFQNYCLLYLSVIAILLAFLVPLFVNYSDFGSNSVIIQNLKLVGFTAFGFLLFETRFAFISFLEKKSGIKKKEPKVEVKKEPEEKEIKLKFDFENLLEYINLNEEYSNKVFEKELKGIIEEIKLLNNTHMVVSVEDSHLYNRMILDEVPALINSYENFANKEDKEEIRPQISECLGLVLEKLKNKNKEIIDIKKLDAKKVIEVIKERY